MTDKQLGKLEKVALREIWKLEARDFTPWLAKEDNLENLSKEIGIELALVDTEVKVGKYNADILCRNVSNGEDSFVLIENQLERTDHTHLGQLLTYATGLNAKTIIWIAEKFNDEHRATLDLLNNITNEDFNFFGIEIELIKIDNSKPALQFDIIAKPNNWMKRVAHDREKIGLTPREQFCIKYWQAFADYANNRNTELSIRAPYQVHWFNFGIGKTHSHYSALFRTKDKNISMELVIKDESKEFFNALLNDKEAIEGEIGSELIWYEGEGNIEAKIMLKKENTNPKSEDDWENQHEWLLDKAEKFDRVFRERVKNL